MLDVLLDKKITKYWTKKTDEEIKNAVFKNLEKNINYYKEGILGVPASYLEDNKQKSQ